MVKSQFAKGFGIFPARENAMHFFTERVPFSYACYGTLNKGMEGKGQSKRAVFLFEMLRS